MTPKIRPPVPKRLFVPEVVQTSEMDCGPASLKALLAGFGIYASYGRLREACQTSVDGTSIDTLEELAVQLGLDAEQVMLPVDHLLLDEAQALPALIVVRLPNGLTHFIVAWSINSRWVQIMDPGAGRRWMSRQRFLDEVFVHHFPVPAPAWREWAGTPNFLEPLHRRMRDLRLADKSITLLTDQALTDPSWRGLAALDAAVRLTAALARANAVETGKEVEALIGRLFEANRAPAPDKTDRVTYPIPPAYWSVQLIPGEAEAPQLMLRGAVLVRVSGRRATASDSTAAAAPLAPDLARVLNDPPVRTGRAVWQALRQDGRLAPSLLAVAIGMAALGITLQALLLEGLLRLGQLLPIPSQKIAGLAALFVLLIVIFLLDLPITTLQQRIGRRLETRLRIAFLDKLPRLSDQYFHSRLTSDMTQRAHGLRSLRTLPELGAELLSTFFQLLLTALGVIWLQPSSALLAILATLAFFALGWITRLALEERDLRLRSHTGALSRFYLDALLGLIPLRAHSAERAFRREHETLLVEWMRAGLDVTRISVALQAAGALLYSGFAVWVVFDYAAKGGATDGALLLFYWTLNLPALNQLLVQQIQQYPLLRNSLLRVLEPLGAPEEPNSHVVEKPDESSDYPTPQLTGVSIEMQEMSVQAGGHTILAEVNLRLAPGEHVAIVGPSGAGKSTLVGVLLGWHRPAGGECRVDGLPLNGTRLNGLRRETAWVDPAVKIWNRTLLENLIYGNETAETPKSGLWLEDADLFGVFERLENGLQTVLGEGGGLVSGGEGQRVRLGRAMNRAHPRLIILDEPFRGLDREQRRALLKKARQFWRHATLLCITHDVGETQDFERVAVIESGRIVEDDAPAKLAARPESRYRALLEAEVAVRKGIWGDAPWRRLWIEEGRLEERGAGD